MDQNSQKSGLGYSNLNNFFESLGQVTMKCAIIFHKGVDNSEYKL